MRLLWIREVALPRRSWSVRDASSNSLRFELRRDETDQQLRRRYAELRMISRASRESVEFLFAPLAIPCIKRSKLSVASRSTSCATVVSEGHAY